ADALRTQRAGRTERERALAVRGAEPWHHRGTPTPGELDRSAALRIVSDRFIYSTSSLATSSAGRSHPELAQSVSQTCNADTAKPANTDGRIDGVSPEATTSSATATMMPRPVCHQSRWFPRPQSTPAVAQFNPSLM